MKPAIQTEYLHTINFTTTNFQLEHGIGGLDRIICEKAKKEIQFFPQIHKSAIVEDNLRNIYPEQLDDFTYQRLEQIFSFGVFNQYDLRSIMQWLVNCDAIPAGSYKIVF